MGSRKIRLSISLPKTNFIIYAVIPSKTNVNSHFYVKIFSTVSICYGFWTISARHKMSIKLQNLSLEIVIFKNSYCRLESTLFFWMKGIQFITPPQPHAVSTYRGHERHGEDTVETQLELCSALSNNSYLSVSISHFYFWDWSMRYGFHFIFKFTF